MAKALKEKDLNLLAALEKRNVPAANASKKRKIIIIAACILLLLIVVVGLFLYQVLNLNNQKDDALLYLNDPKVESAYREAKEKQDEAQSMKAFETWIQEVIIDLDSYPKLSSKDFTQIEGYAGSRIDITDLKYDTDTGILLITGNANSATSIPIFVAQLRMSGLFDEVDYGGYLIETSTESTGTTNQPTGTDIQQTETNSATGGAVTETKREISTYKFTVGCIVEGGSK